MDNTMQAIGAIATIIITGVAVSGIAVLLTMLPSVKRWLRKW